MLQKTVLAVIPAGLPGETALAGPYRAQPAKLATATVANNIVGRACTVSEGGTGQPKIGDNGANPAVLTAVVGGAGVFAGLLSHPKIYAQQDLTGNGLGAIANGTIVELVQESAGEFITLKTAANVGDLVYFETADGELVSAARTANAPAGCNPTPIGELVRYDGETVTGGLYVLHVGAISRPSAVA